MAIAAQEKCSKSEALPIGKSMWSRLWKQSSPAVEEPLLSPDANLPSSSGATWVGEFPLRQGGVVVFTLSPSQPFNIALMPFTSSQSLESQQGGSWLGVRVFSHLAELVLYRGQGQGEMLLARNTLSSAGYTKGMSEAFWMSLDLEGGILKYGKGSRMLERTFLSYDLATGGNLLPVCDRQILSGFFDLGTKQVQLQDYNGPAVVESTIFESPIMASREAAANRVSFDEAPLATDPSPRLLEDNQMVLSDFTQEDFTFPANLCPTLQGLSNKVLQPWLSLDSIVDGNGNVLRDAICHSLETPGLTLHKKLQEKMRNLPPGVAKTSVQLTIALAPNQGKSPGPPVTLEIIPAGHSTTPHDNARSCGVLRALHGHMDVLLFDEDLAGADEAAPLDEVEMERGDAFWFSPTWYQTHAMRNVGTTYCCYLMARQYSEQDTVKWPYLQSKDNTGRVSSHRAVADMGFKEMNTTVMDELSAAVREDESLPKIETDLVRTASIRTKNWVDRTDSAMDYTTADIKAGSPEPMEDHKAHRFSCGFFRRSNLQPPRDVRYLLTSPAIQEEARDLSTVWP